MLTQSQARPFVCLAWLAALLTLMMLLGKDYVGLNLPMPGAMIFFLIFTGYRVMIALTLAQQGSVENK